MSEEFQKKIKEIEKKTIRNLHGVITTNNEICALESAISLRAIAESLFELNESVKFLVNKKSESIEK